MRTYFAVLSLLGALASSQAHAGQMTYSGYITAITSAAEFELNGSPVHVTPATTFAVKQPKSTLRLSTQPALYLGESLEVTGDAAHKTRGMYASSIEVIPCDGTHAEGVGIVDLIPGTIDPAGIIVRADGYLLLLPSTLQPAFLAPLHALADIHTNQVDSLQRNAAR